MVSYLMLSLSHRCEFLHGCAVKGFQLAELLDCRLSNSSDHIFSLVEVFVSTVCPLAVRLNPMFRWFKGRVIYFCPRDRERFVIRVPSLVASIPHICMQR
jgi:hypothetical protein